MKKFLAIILAALLLMPVTSAFANPNAASNTDYVYLLPQEDGSVLYISKFVGVAESGIEFTVPAEATNVKTVEGCELKDGKIVSLVNETTKKVEYQYNLKLKNGEFNYVSPFANTSLTLLTPEGKGLITTKDIDLEADTSAAGDFNMDGINDYFFAAFISEANKPIKFVYDQSAKAPAVPNTAQKTNKTTSQTTSQAKKEEKDTKVTPAEPDNTTLYIVLGTLGVVVVAGVGLYLYFRSQNKNQKSTDSTNNENEDDFVKLAQQRKDILSKISELQSNLETGLISEEEQAEKEKILREKLMKVTVQIKEFTE